jgi:hypothetical protein
MNAIFDLCKAFLIALADLLGITYQAVNVWIFVIIWPLLTLLMLGIILRQRRMIKAMQMELDSSHAMDHPTDES